MVSLAALTARLETNMRREMWRGYVANTAWNIARAMAARAGMSYDAPSYTAMMDDKPKDERTGAEIVTDVLDMLEKRCGCGSN